MIRALAVRIAEKVAAILSGRDSRWPHVRRLHLIDHPCCEACDGTADVEVHHIVPIHVDKSLELDRRNMLTLCRRRDCHYQVGHLGLSWRNWNPDAVNDAETLRGKRAKARVNQR